MENRAIILADIHIGLNTDSYYVKGFGNSRLIEQKQTLNSIVDYAIENKVPKIIIAGDIYDTSNPTAVNEFGLNEIINRITSNKIKLVLLQGNHDYNSSGFGALHPIMALLKDNDMVEIIEHPIIKEDILYMPHLDVKKAQDYTDLVSSMAIKDKPKLLIGHFHAAGAKMGFERCLLSNGEMLIGKYPESVEFAILGHIHKPQHFKVSGIDTVYVGSTQKNDIAENDDEKRFLDIDLSNPNDYKSVPIKCVNYGVVKIKEEEIKEYDWTKHDGQIMHIEIGNFTGLTTREDVRKLIPGTNLIKTIKLITEEEEQIVKDKNNEYKNLDFKECLNKYFKNDKTKEVANNYLERAYETN